MSSSIIRVLISEPEILIALDIEQIVEDFVPDHATIEICNRILTEVQLTLFDVIIVCLDRFEEGVVSALREAHGSGADVIVTSTSDELLERNLPWPVLEKPFSREGLGQLIARLSRKRSPQ
jgi:hypothetical protein